MPLKVTIEIVSQDETRSSPIQTFYIGRLQELFNFEQTSTYVVADTMAGFEAPTSVRFVHKYSDGAEACVQKAIEAREKAGHVWR